MKAFLFLIVITLGIEIQAQRLVFNTQLKGSEVVPPSQSPETGVAVVYLSGNLLEFQSGWAISGNNRRAGGVYGPANRGENAPLIIDFFAIGRETFVPPDNMGGGGHEGFDGVVLITDAQKEDLLSGRWYVSIASVAYPNGEIRGQLEPDLPINDLFALALERSQSAWSLSAKFDGAKAEAGEPVHFRNSNLGSVWFKWRSSASGEATVFSTGTNFASGLIIYTGAGVSNLISKASSGGVKNPATDGPVTTTFPAELGMTYYIALVAPTNSSGPYQISFSQPSVPVVLENPTPLKSVALNGHAATFRASITGLPLPQVYWQHSSDGTIWTNVIGGRLETLTIERVQITDAGFYRLTATNALGNIQTLSAKLEVLESANPGLIQPVSQNGVFRFEINEIEGYTYVVEGASTLSMPIQWTALRTNAAPFAFTETNSSPQRFYRSRLHE